MEDGGAEAVDARYYASDPLYSVYCKLFIRQLWRLPCLNKSLGVYSLGGHPISRVEVCGTIVRRDPKASRLLFALDDATGLIEILVWERRFEREMPIDWDRLSLGALVRVRGRLSSYRDAPQLTLASVDYLPEASDGFLEETAQWEAAMKLNAEIYFKDPASSEGMSLPKGLEEERTILQKALCRDAPPETVLEAMGAAFGYLSELPTGQCSEWDLRNVFQVDHKMLRDALVMLCDHGGAFWAAGEAVVEQIRPEENLASAILTVIKSSGSAGATMIQIQKDLMADYRWRCVRDDLMEAGLAWLAHESKVFNGGDGFWKLV